MQPWQLSEAVRKPRSESPLSSTLGESHRNLFIEAIRRLLECVQTAFAMSDGLGKIRENHGKTARFPVLPQGCGIFQTSPSFFSFVFNNFLTPLKPAP